MVIWYCTKCSHPEPPKMYYSNGKQMWSRKGYKHFCKKCFPTHVCGDNRHSRRTAKRPYTAAANRLRGNKGN